MEPIIRVRDLRKVYRSRGEAVRAVDGVTFDVGRGEVFSFLGPNGAGKTTTVEILECIRRPTSGKVSVAGYDISRHPERVKRVIGVLPQDFSATPNLTVKENVWYFSRMYDSSVDIDELLARVGLEEKCDRLFRTLSGGEKKRVGIATALVNDPEVVFLDEPTSGIDPAGRRMLWGMIRDLKKRGKTVFLTTHYTAEAEHLSDRSAVINKGRVVCLGSPSDLIMRYGQRPLVRISRLDERGAAVLREAGFEPADAGGMDITFHVEGSEDYVKVAELLSREGARYGSLGIYPSTLEDVFFAVTGEEFARPEGGGS